MEEKEIILYNTPEDGVAPTITTMYARLGTNNLTPGEYGGAMGIMEVKSCASRKRGDEHKIETRNDELANCVTSIDTDSMICEPTKVIGSMQEHAYQGSVYGVSPCVNAAAGMGGGHIPMVVEEPLKIPQATRRGYIECPVGGVFDASYPNSELRRGRVQEDGEISPALTTNSESAILRYEGVEPQIIQKVGKRGTDNYSIKDISNTVPANPMSDRGQLLIEPQILTPLRTEEGRQLRKQGIEKFSNRALYPREDGVSNTITSFQKDNLLQEPTDTTICLNSKVNGKQPSVFDRVYSEEGCSVAITSGWLQNVCTEDKNGTEYKGKFIKEGETVDTSRSGTFGTHIMDGVSPTLRSERPDANATCIKNGARYRIRKLTEREVFRLMDVSEEDIDKIQAAGISKTAQYKLAGNSIVVSCLYHIFRKCFIELGCEEQQLSLF